jgi:transposase
MTVGRTYRFEGKVAEETAAMLKEPSAPVWSEIDLEVFQHLVAPDHYVRRAMNSIDFEQFRDVLAAHYSPDRGRPAEDPVRMLKLEFLQYHDVLSDRQVIARARSDVAYRYFLGLSLKDELPEASSLSIFRGRLGVEGHAALFEELVAQAREHGLVKDRLRLKDATHVIADVAVPTTLALLAQTRDKLLAAAQPLEPLRTAGEQARVEVLRLSTEGSSVEERLATRVTHVREILSWVDELAPPNDADDNRVWQQLVAVRQLAHKILADQDNPKKGDRTLSTVDPDARRAKHGQWYDGYLLDVMIDADSELITAIDVLPANGNEAANAAELVRQEEAAHGNDIEALSIDGVAFQGPVLRELESSEGLGLDVYVPPTAEASSGYFSPQDFTEDPVNETVTCPAGQSTARRQRNTHDTGWAYRFSHGVCAECPLLDRCMQKLPTAHGRKVIKNEYEAEYRRMRAKAKTPRYAEVRRKHPKIERKLSELVRRHGARRARYRGRWKVLPGQLMAAFVTNVKRIGQLLSAPEVAAGMP